MKNNFFAFAIVNLLMLIIFGFGMFYWLDLPNDWFTADGWQRVSASHKMLFLLGSSILSLIGTILVLAFLRSRATTAQPSIDALMEAARLGRIVDRRFFNDCKGGVDNIEDYLLEDIPSTVGLAEEQRWLDQNRHDLARIEALLKRTIELVKVAHGSPADLAFNIANTYTKLGAHYKFCREYDNAIPALKEAITRLTDLTKNGGDRGIGQELATAFFYLGETYMARWRLADAPKDREHASQQFHLSIREDEKWGNQSFSSIAKKRLRSL